MQPPGARFDHANASDSEWHEVNLDDATAPSADIDGRSSDTRAWSTPISVASIAPERVIYSASGPARAIAAHSAHRVALANDGAALAALGPQWLAGHTGRVWACGFRRTVAGWRQGGTTGRCGCGTWRADRSAPLRRPQGGVWACGFSPDGRWLATGATGRCGCGTWRGGPKRTA